MHAGVARGDEVVREDRERRVAHHRRRAQHGVAQTQRRRLADVDAGHVRRHDVAHHLQHVLLAAFLERGFELVGGVEVVRNGALAAAVDEDEFGDTRPNGFLHRVLDQRLVDHRQHFLRIRLGGRQKARAESGDRKHGLGDPRDGRHRLRTPDAVGGGDGRSGHEPRGRQRAAVPRRMVVAAGERRLRVALAAKRAGRAVRAPIVTLHQPDG